MSDDAIECRIRSYVPDTVVSCARCRGSGFVDDQFCTCAIGVAWRSAPRLTIGNDTHVFPPGTTMEQAQAVLDEAKKRFLDGLS